MLSGLAQAGTKALGGARFTLVSIVPSAWFVGFVAFLSLSGLYSGKSPNLAYAATALGSHAGWVVAAIFAIFVIAVLLRPFQAVLVQFLEGYWSGIRAIEHIYDLAIERHRRIRHTAEVVSSARLTPKTSSTSLHEVARAQRVALRAVKAQKKAHETVSRYPSSNGVDAHSDDRLMPTMLGNALRDGEDTAGSRYGLTFRAIAPRLYPHLSTKMSEAISQNLDLIDTTAALCISFGLSAVISAPLVVRWDVWSSTPFAMLILSIIAYSGALRTARGHARLLATAVDLHRFDMLAALHYDLPTSPEEERRLNQRLSAFFDERESAAELIGDISYSHNQQCGAHPEEQPPSSSASSGA